MKALIAAALLLSPESLAAADITFPGAFVMKNIGCSGSGDAVLPLSYGADGRDYADIRVTARRFYEKLRAACGEKGSAIMDNETIGPDFRTVSARKLGSEVRIANVDVEFDWQLAVTFGLLKLSRKKRNSSERTEYFRLAMPRNFNFVSEGLRDKVRRAVIAEGLRAAKNENN